MNKPNLFILGAPKCGTTSLYYYLSQHPDIFCPKIKEPHYYNTDDVYRFYNNEIEYYSLFENGMDSRYRCDGSTMYYHSKVAVQNILNEVPESKFIYIIRNPIEHFYSLHQQMYYNGDEVQKDPMLAWTSLSQKKLTTEVFSPCINPNAINYTLSCSLGKHLKSLTSKLNQEQLLVLVLDDLKENPEAVLKRIFAFLKVDTPKSIDLEIKNQSIKKRKLLLLKRITRYLFKIKRNLDFNFSFGLLNWLDKFNTSIAETNFVNDNIVKNSKLNKILLTYFSPDIEIIETFLNRKFDSWRAKY